MSAAANLELRDIGKVFGLGRGGVAGLLSAARRPRVHAVSDVSLRMGRREVLGLVGESGCGKSTLGRIVAGLVTPTSGEILLQGNSLTAMARPERRHWARRIQMIFQNPYASLNPGKTIRQTIEEPLRVHKIIAPAQIADAAAHLLDEVGLDPALGNRHPHQLSGGQCQRVGIARALSVEPEILVCDEPVSALDVSIQAQVLNLFADLRERRVVSYLFISHDLGVVERLSDRVAVMYLGRIVETAPRETLFELPMHPYTQALIEAVPKIGRHRARGSAIVGERPSPLRPPAGCHFHPRCPRAMARCRTVAPSARELAPGHVVACHLYD